MPVNNWCQEVLASTEEHNQRHESKRVEHLQEPDDERPGTSTDNQGASSVSSTDKLEELSNLVTSLAWHAASVSAVSITGQRIKR